MKEGVIEVGPATVRGSIDIPAHLVSAALDHLDDDIALVDDHPVAVEAVWRELFRAALPDRLETAVLICPTWWSPLRIERIREAAAIRAANVVVRHRAELLAQQVAGNPTVVEIASDLWAVSREGQVVSAKPRLGENADVIDAVIDEISTATMVLVDAPVGVAGAVEVADAIAGGLRANGVTAMTIRQDRVLAAARQPPTPPPRPAGRPRRAMPRTMVSAVLVAVVLLWVVGLGADTEPAGLRTDEVPMTLLVEGRVALKVPALWAVRRISSGPGSARVEVSAPDSSAAVLVTQSQVRKREALSRTAATLRSALDDQPAGVFRDFNPADRRADRAAVTYREIRDGREIDWVVFVDEAVRIGIGCQRASDEEHVVNRPCEEAVRSAHALF